MLCASQLKPLCAPLPCRHIGSPPPVGQQGNVISFDHWASARSHAVQQVIRAASGDARLMNPMAYVESHPAARYACGVGARVCTCVRA